MNRKIWIALAGVAILAGIILCMVMMSKENNKIANNAVVQENTEIAEEIVDECTDDYEQMQAEELEAANAEEVKTSPNAVITFERFYKECEHTTNRYEEISEELVNKTKEEFQNEYSSWTIKSFEPESIVLYKELDGQCGEHYMLRDVDGKINIYELSSNGDEILMEATDIATEYLAEADITDIENGLIVYGKENLNMLLEDFE